MFQCYGVQAVALAGRGWTVGEDVPEMCVATRATRLAADHAVRPIGIRGDRVVVDMPGGGGLGDPKARDAEIVVADVRSGVVSEDAARTLYGVAVTPGGELDGAATAKLRA